MCSQAGVWQRLTPTDVSRCCSSESWQQQKYGSTSVQKTMLRCCKHGASGQHRQIEQKDWWLSRQDDGSAQELARVATVPRTARDITKSETRAPVNIGCSTSAITYSSAYVTCQPALIIPITHASTHPVHRTVLLNIDHKHKEDA